MAETIKGINVVIGAETSGLSKALSDVNKQGRDIQKELKEVEKLLKLDPTNTELLAQKQKLLGDAVANTREKLDRLKTAQQQVNEQFEKGQISEGQYRAFQREIVKTEAELKKFEQQLATIDDTKAIDNLKKDFQGVSKEAENAQHSIKGVGSELTGIAAGLAVGGGIAGAISKALDLSTLNTKIDISMEVPPEAMAAVKNAIFTANSYIGDQEAALEGVRRQWALNAEASDEANAKIVKGAAAISHAYSGIDFTELIQETNEISRSLGITNEDALGLVNSLLKMGFPPEQLDIISEYGTQLKMAGYDAEEIQAIFAAGVDTGSWNIDNLLDGLKEGRIRLAEFGQEVPKSVLPLIDGTGITVKQLQEWGRAVAEGGEAGKQAMREVAEAVNGVEDETKKSQLGVAIWGTMFEDQGQAVIDTLLNANAETVSLQKNQELLNDTVSRLDSDPTVQFSQAMQSLREAASPLLEVIAGVVSSIANWAKENPELAATITTIVAALGTLLGLFLALSPILISIASLAGALGVSIGAVAGPIAIAIAAIAALAAAAYLIYDNWEPISQFFIDLWEGIKQFFITTWEWIQGFFGEWGTTILAILAPFIGIPLLIMENWEPISEFFIELWESITEIASEAWDLFAETITGTVSSLIASVVELFHRLESGVTQIWDGLSMYFEAVWDIIKSVFLGAILLIYDLVTGNFSKLSSDAQLIWNSLKDAFGRIWEAIKLIFSGALDAISTYISFIWGLITEKTTAIWEAIKEFFVSLWDDLKTLIETSLDAMQSNIKKVWTTIRDFFVEMWGIIKQVFSDGITTAKTTISEGMGKMVDLVMDFVGDFVNAGEEFVRGLWEGIRNKTSWLWNQIKGWLDGLMNQIRGSISGGSSGNHGNNTGDSSMSGAGGGAAAASFSVPGLKDGGTVKKAGWTWTGENGPELLYLPQGSQVIPNYEIPQIGSQAIDYDELARAMAAHMKPSVTMNNTFNSPTPLSPAETARKNLKVSRQLAMEWGM